MWQVNCQKLWFDSLRGLMEQLIQDLKFGLRSMRRNYGFTILAVLTLSLGLGANTAVFSIVNALLLRPYPFADLDRLILVRQAGASIGGDTRVAPSDFYELRRETTKFEELAAFQLKFSNLTDSGGSEGLVAAAVSPNFFAMLGVHASIGRAFTAEEGEPGRDQVAILNHGYWTRRFAGDPNLLGRSITINGRNVTVVGIMAADLQYPRAVDLWMPLALTSQQAAEHSRPSVQVLGRLRPSVSLDQSRGELQAVAARLKQLYPTTHQSRGLQPLRLRDEQFNFIGVPALMLQTCAIFVLLLACVNLVNLLFARLVSRQRELAIRAAMGASKPRLARLFTAETLPLAFLAGVVALSCSAWSVDAIRNVANPNYTKWIAGWERIQVDRHVIGFAFAVTTIAGILFGLGAAWRSGRSDLNEALKSAGGRSGSGFDRQRLRSALVVVQVVFATVLLIGSGLMVKGFLHLNDAYRSLDPHAVLSMRLSLPEQRYPDDERIRTFYQRLLQEIAAQPGVQLAGIITNAPASNVDNAKSPFLIEGRTSSLDDPPQTDVQSLSPDYLRAVRIPMVEGRGLSEQDGPDSPRVAVISRTMARQIWPDGSPIGHRIKIGPPNSTGPWTSVVGVVEDVKQNWWDQTPRPVVYLSYLQAPRRTVEFGIRTSGEPLAIASAVRRAIARVDPAIAAQEGVSTLENSIADSLAPIRILGALMSIFGAIALVLSALGVYGILAHSVAQRAQEFGIRMALGAEQKHVTRLVLGYAGRLAGIGITIGLPLAYVLTRVTASLLHGIMAFNAAIFVSLAALLVVIAIAAAYVPLRRALRIHPIQALRCD
jgi:putative ABC transport system permease protein